MRATAQTLVLPVPILDITEGSFRQQCLLNDSGISRMESVMKEYQEPYKSVRNIEKKKPYEKPVLIELGDVATLSRFDVSVNA